MPANKSWLPAARTDQLALVKNWLAVLAAKGAAWNIPQTEIDALAAAANKAETTLALALSSGRTPVITAQCKADFDALVERARFIKGRFFMSPPLTGADLASLELNPKDTVHTSRSRPRAQMTAEIGRSGTAMLLLKLIYAEGTESLADPHTDAAYQIRYGKHSPLAPRSEPAKGETVSVPAVPEELPIAFTTKRRRETITFEPGDSGKTAYFAIRIDNGRGGDESYGPWCPVFSAVIP